MGAVEDEGVAGCCWSGTVALLMGPGFAGLPEEREELDEEEDEVDDDEGNSHFSAVDSALWLTGQRTRCNRGTAVRMKCDPKCSQR